MNTAIMQYREKNQKGGRHSDVIREVKAEIIFGMPSKDCANYGICKISRSHEGPSRSLDSDCTICQLYKASATLLLNDKNELEMRCLADSLSEETMEKHFSKDEFYILEDYHCTDDICNALQTNELVLKEGTYTVQRSEDYLTILFY